MKVMNVEILAWEEDGPQLIYDIEQWIKNYGSNHTKLTGIVNRYPYDRTAGRYTIVMRVEGFTNDTAMMFALQFSNHIKIMVNRLP